MDWSTIVVALLALIGTLAGSYFSNSRTTALIEYRLQALEEKVNKHNNVVERMAIVEKVQKDTSKAIDELKIKIEKLEDKH